MKATIALEYIGEAYDAKLCLYSKKLDLLANGLGQTFIGKARPRKPWVAEIKGKDAKFGWKREFLHANWQRKRANSAHTRGVELWFVLESGRVYEVKEPVSWKNSDRYFCTVDNKGRIVRVREELVEQCLNAN